MTAYIEIFDPGFDIGHEGFRRLGSLVDSRNVNGYRKTPVTFRNGGSSCQAFEISQQLEKLMENINVFLTDTPNSIVEAGAMAKALTREFLWIHPFVDGNGRVGFLLYNYLLDTLDDPKPLPDFNW